MRKWNASCVAPIKVRSSPVATRVTSPLSHGHSSSIIPNYFPLIVPDTLEYFTPLSSRLFPSSAGRAKPFHIMGPTPKEPTDNRGKREHMRVEYGNR